MYTKITTTTTEATTTTTFPFLQIIKWQEPLIGCQCLEVQFVFTITFRKCAMLRPITHAYIAYEYVAFPSGKELCMGFMRPREHAELEVFMKPVHRSFQLRKADTSRYLAYTPLH